MKTTAPLQRKTTARSASSVLARSRGFGPAAADPPAHAGHDFGRVAVDRGAGAEHDVALAGTAAPAGALPFRARLERSFGTDLGWVKAHRGPAAREAADALGTGAYAHRGAVVLGAKSDLATVAEETAHVLQQAGGGGTGAAVEPRHSPAEVEAAAAARAVTAGHAVAPPAAPLAPATVALNGGGGAEHKKNLRPSNRAKHQKGIQNKVVNAKAAAKKKEKEKGKKVAKPAGGRG
jgi:hypothetical protein